MAEKDEDFWNMNCVYTNSNTNTNVMVPVRKTKMDYVGICKFIIYIAWCQLPLNVKINNINGFSLDFGKSIIVDPKYFNYPPNLIPVNNLLEKLILKKTTDF